MKIRHKKIKQVFIDIFPHDFYYNNVQGKDKKFLNKKIKFIRKMMSLSPFRIKEDEVLSDRIKYLTQTIINENIDIRANELDDEFDYNQKKEDSSPIINENIEVDERITPSIHWGLDFPHRWNNWIYDYSQIFPLKKLKFEDYKFSVPADTDFMLKNIYGDYMKMPKSICPHHTDEDAFTEEEKQELLKLKEMN